MHADKQPEPLNLGVPVVYFPRANAFLARAQALFWVRDCVTTVNKRVQMLTVNGRASGTLSHRPELIKYANKAKMGRADSQFPL